MSTRPDRNTIILSNALLNVLCPLLDIQERAKVRRVIIDAEVNQPVRVIVEQFGTEDLLQLDSEAALAGQYETATAPRVTAEMLRSTLREGIDRQIPVGGTFIGEEPPPYGQWLDLRTNGGDLRWERQA